MNHFKINHFDFIRIIVSSFLFLIGFFFLEGSNLQLIIWFISYFLIGYDIILSSLIGIFKGKVLDEKFLMTITTFGAFFIGEIPEGIAVMLLYQLGEWLGDCAVDKSKKEITQLLELKSNIAHLKKDNSIIDIDPSHIKVSSIIVVKPGERVPLDGIIRSGSSTLDTSSLTGESIPRNVNIGDSILSGVINLTGVLEIETTTTSKDSTVSRMYDFIQSTSEKQSTTEKFITKFARVYTPIIVLLSFLLFVIPTFVFRLNFSTWLYRSLVFLVVSCPCALVISIPLGFFCGIGVASKNGILVKGSNELEKMKQISTFVFDKTGTITKGNFEVVEIYSDYQEKLIYYASHLESYSSHPIALAIQKLGSSVDMKKVSEIKEFAGNGIKGIIDQKEILVGKREFLKQNGILLPEVNNIGTNVFVSVNNQYIGYFVIADVIKETSKEAIVKLQQQNCSTLVMLSGDNELIVEEVAKKVGISQYYGNLLPEDKVQKIEELKKKESVAFIGDGMNDAMVLLSSDIGISMGGIGSDVAIEASDIVLMDDDLTKIPKLVSISKKTSQIVWQNIIFAIAVKMIILLLGFFGYSTIWMAVFADVGVTILVIFNTLRIMYSRY